MIPVSAGPEKHIAGAFSRFGVPRDSTLFVHSSFKACGREGGDPVNVLEAMLEYMAPGTLMLPTMSWRFVKPSDPFFDELKTPSNVGILTEIFRTRYADGRSIHPTHSVAAKGKDAAALLDGHHLDDTPCSANSPFGRLCQADGWVVMFGISMDCCTLIHHVEEIIAPDLYLQPVERTEHYNCRRRNGEEISVALRRHLFLPRDYWQFQDIIAADGKLSVFAIGNTVIRAFRARDLVSATTRVLEHKPDAVIARPGQRYRMM
ncbi:AAC(3) family N-acetyltransferase [bacterium SCSIO 12827]|nr:AAC(3) family N-acetyltransferase [bacterium SCSIO 12827]